LPQLAKSITDKALRIRIPNPAYDLQLAFHRPPAAAELFGNLSAVVSFKLVLGDLLQSGLNAL